MPEHTRSPIPTAGLVVAAIAAVIATALAAAIVMNALKDDSAASWLLGRASGVTSYILMVVLVCAGLVLSHPWARRIGPSASVLGVHVALATFTLVFTLLHVVVLATDEWAKVGWSGALLPMASGYRPVPVTLGVLAVWAGLVTGLSARFAGRFAARLWWPLHKVAMVIFVLVWTHSVLAGTDAFLLREFYLATGAIVLGLALTRYAARSNADRVSELNHALTQSVDHSVNSSVNHPASPGARARRASIGERR